MKNKKSILSIISFGITFLALILVIITDLIIFREVIATVIAAVFISAMAFVFFILLMVVSILFVFGVIILEEHGFWPLDRSIDVFNEIIKSASITAQQLEAFRWIRLIILILAISSFVISIITLKKDKKTKEKNKFSWMSVIALIFSLLGIIVTIGILVVTNFISL